MNPFTIRGYVAEVREKDSSIGYPFPKEGAELPQIRVPEFGFWRWEVSLQSAEAENADENGGDPDLDRSDHAPKDACLDENEAGEALVLLSCQELGSASAPIIITDDDDDDASVYVDVQQEGDAAKKGTDVAAVKSELCPEEVHAAKNVNEDASPSNTKHAEEASASAKGMSGKNNGKLKDSILEKIRTKRPRTPPDSGAREATELDTLKNNTVDAIPAGTTCMRKRIKLLPLKNIVSRCSSASTSSEGRGLGIDLNDKLTEEEVDVEVETESVNPPGDEETLSTPAENNVEEELHATFDHDLTRDSSYKETSVANETGNSSGLILQDETPHCVRKQNDNEEFQLTPMAGGQMSQRSNEIVKGRPQSPKVRPSILLRGSGHRGTRASTHQYNLRR